ncbi:MAG: Rrf2 family transcriptional regulator [Patescibacteria group bacterium]|nr:Rrf2 family transcriptional regulator [Candidatus Beckwithbacteria bacterium]MDZ4229235.1 Rrf2 family transcriptional regulator [Patescibacteria group bacterium]
MLKLKRETDLGLVLLEELTDLAPGKYLSLQPWANKRHLPYRFLSKVAGNLKRSGLVVAKEGKDGGYRLAKNPAKIKLGQAIKALEGSLALTRCHAGAKCSCRQFCQHRSLMGRLGQTLENELDKVSLQTLYAGD